MYDIIGRKKIYLGFSLILTIAAIASIGAFGLKEGIDFKGGTSWQVRFASDPSAEAVRAAIEDNFGIKEATVVSEPTTRSVIIRLKELDEKLHAEYRTALADDFGALEELGYETIGPAIGSELKNRAIWAFLGVLVAISLYVAFAFRHVSRPVSSWKYALITLVTLFHDALIPLGLVAYLGHAYGVEMNTNVIVALLVVMGFSVHDTIVVFDRIRENLRLERQGTGSFAGLVNASVNQTMVRSVNTSLTLVLTLVALLAIGSASLFYFVLTILVGVSLGTYSSIFVASPLLVLSDKAES